MRPSNDLENNTPWDTYWRVQLVCMKDQAHGSLERPLKSGFVSAKKMLMFLKQDWNKKKRLKAF